MIEDQRLIEKLRNLQLLAFDFDGVFTDGKVLFCQDGTETVVCSRKDALGIELLKAAGVKVVVISQETNLVVRKRCEKMKVECYSGQADKLPLFQQLLAKEETLPARAAFMGDDVNDLMCLRHAGLAFTVADGHPTCLMAAHYITKREGGDHAVREVCDLILNAKRNSEPAR